MTTHQRLGAFPIILAGSLWGLVACSGQGNVSGEVRDGSVYPDARGELPQEPAATDAAVATDVRSDAAMVQAENADGASAEPLPREAGPMSPPTTVCAPGGFCWEHPLPQGVDLRGVWMSSHRGAIAVGDRGVIVRWDGHDVRADTSGTTQTLFAVSGNDYGQVWAVGAGETILHWDGARWSRQHEGTADDAGFRAELYGVWSDGKDSAWAVGSAGRVLRYRAGRWETAYTDGPSVRHRAVWGDGSSLYVAGMSSDPSPASRVLRLDASGWAVETFADPIASDLRALSGRRGRVVAVGSDGTVLERGANAVWARAKVPSGDSLDSRLTLTSAQITDAGDLWVGATSAHLFRITASHTERMPVPTDVFALAGTDGGTLVSVGSMGAMSVLDGNRMRPLPDPWIAAAPAPYPASLPLALDSLRGAHGADDKLWVAAGSGILHWNGTNWLIDPVTDRVGEKRELWDVWGSSASDIWAVGDRRILHYDGASFRTPTSMPRDLSSRRLRAVWGARQNDVWFVGDSHSTGDGVVVRWDGRDFRDVPLPAGIHGVTSVWGSGSDDVWMAARDLYRWDGSSVTQVALSGLQYATLKHVHGTRNTNVWAIGDHELFHFDGTAWRLVTRVAPAEATFEQLWVESENRVWVSAGAVVYRWDGQRLEVVPTGSNRRVQRVYGTADGTMRIVGERASVLSFR